MNFTSAASLGYPARAAGGPAAGYESPKERGDKPRCSSKAAFLRLGYGRVTVQAGQALRAAGFVSRKYRRGGGPLRNYWQRRRALV